MGFQGSFVLEDESESAPIQSPFPSPAASVLFPLFTANVELQFRGMEPPQTEIILIKGRTAKGGIWIR